MAKPKLKPIKTAIAIVGQAQLARACGVTEPAVHRWGRLGLPRTAWTGEKPYAQIIERETGGQVTVEMLLASRH